MFHHFFVGVKLFGITSWGTPGDPCRARMRALGQVVPWELVSVAPAPCPTSAVRPRSRHTASQVGGLFSPCSRCLGSSHPHSGPFFRPGRWTSPASPPGWTVDRPRPPLRAGRWTGSHLPSDLAGGPAPASPLGWTVDRLPPPTSPLAWRVDRPGLPSGLVLSLVGILAYAVSAWSLLPSSHGVSLCLRVQTPLFVRILVTSEPVVSVVKSHPTL